MSTIDIIACPRCGQHAFRTDDAHECPKCGAKLTDAEIARASVHAHTAPSDADHQRAFVRECAARVVSQALADIDAGNVPAGWDGARIRGFLAERFKRLGIRSRAGI